MLKLDVFLWLTVKCYSELSTERYSQISGNARQKKVQKRLSWGKKESMEQRETNQNGSYYN